MAIILMFWRNTLSLMGRLLRRSQMPCLCGQESFPEVLTVELRKKKRDDMQRPEGGHSRQKKANTIKKTLFHDCTKIYTHSGSASPLQRVVYAGSPRSCAA